MTEFEIASDILNLVTSNEGVTNSRLRMDQVLLDVDSMRLRLIAEAEKALVLRKPYQGYSQRIKSLKVQRNPDRSLFVEIPKVYVDANGKPAIGYIGSTDGKTSFRIITGMHNTSHDEFISAYPTVHYSEGLLKFRNTTAENIAILDTIFEDPSALEVYGEYNGETSGYPLPGVMIDLLIGKVANGYLNTMYRKLPQPNTQTDLPIGGGK
jgi:hypothetical protein